MQKKSYEDGVHEGLGWIDAEVKRFEFGNKTLKVPHVGWNDVNCNTKSKMFEGAKKVQTFYFVHSYYVEPKDKEIVAGKCEYGITFAAAIEKKNILATQFHPEKSQKDGLQILEKFMKL